MSLFALIAALLLQKFRPFSEPDPLSQWLNRLAAWVHGYANIGERRYSVLAWFAVMLIAYVPLTLLYYLFDSTATLLGWIVACIVLYLAIRFRTVLSELEAIRQALRQNDLGQARERLGRWMNSPWPPWDERQISKAAIEYAVLSCYSGLFGVVFWFVVLPGPAGAVVYRAAVIMARQWRPGTEADGYPFGLFARRMLDIMDWIPQRLTAISFAIVGDFEDALYCWRSQAQAWGNPIEGVVLASAAGAMGVRLGEPLEIGDQAVHRPAIGLGDEADADFIQSTEGLLWRAVLLWSVCLLLVAVIQVIG